MHPTLGRLLTCRSKIILLGTKLQGYLGSGWYCYLHLTSPILRYDKAQQTSVA